MLKKIDLFDSIHMEYYANEPKEKVLEKMKMKNIYDLFDVEIQELENEKYLLTVVKINKAFRVGTPGNQFEISFFIREDFCIIVWNYIEQLLFNAVPSMGEAYIDKWMETKVDAKKIPRENWMYFKK